MECGPLKVWRLCIIFVTMQPELWHKKCQNGFYLFLFFRNWGFCDKTCKAETLPSKLQELKLDVGKEKKCENLSISCFFLQRWWETTNARSC